MPPKKPKLSAPSRPDSGASQLQATGSAVPLKVPSPPPDRPVASGLQARTSQKGGAAAGAARRAGSRARRVPAATDAVHVGMIGGGGGGGAVAGREAALRPGVAAALSSRATEKLWSAPLMSDPSSTEAPVGSAVRVGRLLRDARAAVRGPARPETPVAYLQPGPTRRRSATGAMTNAPRPPPGRRLAALRPLDTTAVSTGATHTSTAAAISGNTLSPSSAAAVAASVVRNSQLDPDTFLTQLITAEGNAAVQVALLRELDRWLSNPMNRLWPELVEYCRDFLNTAVEYPGADRRADLAVSVVMGSLLLRNTVDALTSPAIPPLARLLRMEVQGAGHTASALHVSCLLEKEALYEPLFYLLKSCCCGGGGSGSDAAMTSPIETHTNIALDVLEVLRGCTTIYDVEKHATQATSDRSDRESNTRRSSYQWGHTDADSLSNRETDEEACREQEVHVDRLCQLFATSGLLPTLNTLFKCVLQIHRDRGDEDMVSGMLLPSACLLLRNIARNDRQIGHLRRLGTLELLLQVMESYQVDIYTMEAASRALAKLVFIPECLAFYQESTRLIEAAASTLLFHTASIAAPEGDDARSGSCSTLSTHVKVLVARLCTTMARVAEGCADQLEVLAKTSQQVLLPRLVDYFVTGETVQALQALKHEAAGEQDRSSSSGGGVDGGGVRARRQQRGTLDMPFADGVSNSAVLEGLVWLVGLVAMSAACTTTFVRVTAPALTDLIKTLDFDTSTRLAAIYTLMALSNLSYLFATIENEEQAARAGEGDPGASALSTSAPTVSPFLSELYEGLGLSLAGFLFEGDAEATVEATRILGNMSFTNTGRDWMEINRCDEVMVIFLGHEDLRVVYNSFGVLLNLTAATRCRIVEEPELLRMLLQNTGRFTRREDIDLAAKEEKRHLLETALNACDTSGDDGGNSDGRRGRRPILTEKEAARLAVLEAQELATGYAAQIAELVEKVLENVHGLILGPSAAAREEGDEDEDVQTAS